MIKRLLSTLVFALTFAPALGAQTKDYIYDPTSTVYDPDYTNTYSIIARDPETGEMGIGVASRVLAVGRNGSSFRGGVGVIVHQAASDPYYGRVGMEMLDAGLDPQEVMARLVRSDLNSASRQVAILDAQVQNLARSFESSKGSGKSLAERLVDALDAANSGGADIRGQQSAALFIVKKLAGAGGYSDVSEDLRVNDSPLPIVELRRLLTLRNSGGVIAAANRQFEAGDREGGLRALMALREKIPTSDAVWIALAGMYTRMARKADALAMIKQAVELNPYNARTMQGGLPRNETFASLRSDSEWIRIMSVWPLKDPDGLHPARATTTPPRP